MHIEDRRVGHRRPLPLAAAVLLVLLQEGAQAAASGPWRWRELTPGAGSAPAARRNGSAVYDPVMRRVVVFGGSGATGLLGDVWAFDLVRLSWTRLQTTGTPPSPRLGHNAVYDPAGHRMIVWAGQQGSIFHNDTTALDLTTLTWSDLSPASRPTSRYGSAAVFDAVQGRLVQFAGFTAEGTRFQDTQSFSVAARSWTNVTPAGSLPGVRCLHTAALDRAGRRMFVYGGQRFGPLDDLWVFDLSAHRWAELTPATRPPGRFWPVSFVDRAGDFLVFGGSTPSGDSNETWSYSPGSGQWARLDIPGPPSPRNGMMEAYVEADDRIIVFGGSGGSGLLGDVWELARAPDPQAGTAHFAQVANGEGWSSIVVLANPSAAETTSGSIALFDDSGAPLSWSWNGAAPVATVPFSIPPLGSARFASDALGRLVAGWARVSASAPVAGVVELGSPDLGTAGVGASPPLQSFIAPVSRSTARRASTGLAVAAVGAPATLEATLRDLSGQPVAGGTASVSLPANGHMALFVEELFPGADTRDFEGAVTVVSAGGEVVATVIRLGSRAGALTTLPVTPLR